MEMEAKVQKDSSSRIFSGSWFLVIAPPIIAFLVIWARIGSDETIETKWLIEFLIYMVGGSIFYYFASLVPIRVALARAKKIEESDDPEKPSLRSLIFSDFFKSSKVRYNIYDGNGSFKGTETRSVGGFVNIFAFPFYLLIYLMILLVKASLVFYWAIFSFMRNYIYLWMFPKKSGYKD